MDKAELSKELFGRQHWLGVAEHVRDRYLSPPVPFRSLDVQDQLGRYGVGRTTTHESLRSLQRLGMVARATEREPDGSVWLRCEESALWEVVGLVVDVAAAAEKGV